MAAGPPVMLVLAGAVEMAPELHELLGPQRVGAVERLLMHRATQWARKVSPGRVRVADRGGAIAPSERLRDAVERVMAEEQGSPVIVVWPALPRWRPEHAAGILGDLDAGCEASVGPVFDGGLYVLALTRVVPSLFALPGETWESPETMGVVLNAINEAGLEVGLLRAERGLRRPGDVRAALADPLLDLELRALLEG